jgi:uncharacterized protein YggE
VKKIFIFLLFITAIALNAQNTPRFITVSGTAEVIVPADCIVFNVQIKTINESMAQAKRQNDKNLDDLLTTIKSAGVTSEDFEVAPVSLGKNYEYGASGRKEKGYFAAVNLTFKLRDFTKYLSLTEQISKSPSIELNSSFELSKAKLQSLSKDTYCNALKAAKEKAEYMAAALGAKLGPVAEIEEAGADIPFVPVKGGRASNFSTKMDAGMQNEAVEGKIVVSKSVSVKFDLINLL